VHFLRFFRWHVLRYVLQRPLLAALNVLSVAIGVAVFLAVQLANQSANKAFRATIDFVAGKADLEVTGTGGNIPEELLPVLSKRPEVVAATPLVRGIITLPDFPGEYLDVLGVDVLTNVPFRTFELTDLDATSFAFEQWLRGPDSLAISESFAKQHHLAVGDRIRASVNTTTIDLTVRYLLRSASSGNADAHFAAIDIGWAQEIFDRRGKLDSIQLRTAPGLKSGPAIARLYALLPPGVRIATPQRRSEQIAKIVGSFQLNLTALSLVALFVGVFLIYNTISASVVRRRHEIGIVRALGVSAAAVKTLFVAEAAVVATAGTFVGLILGTTLATALISTVSRTISALYLLVTIRDVSLDRTTYFAACGVGLLSGILGAWMPARAAGQLEISAALAPQIAIPDRTNRRYWTVIALVLIVAAALCSWLALTVAPPWLGFAAAFFTLSGFSFLAPLAVRVASWAAEGIVRFSRTIFRARLLAFRMASAQLVRSLARNAVTIAALASAVAMTIGVTVMIFSFRRTVGSWIDQTLVADLFVVPASNEITGPVSFLPREVAAFFENDSRVAAIDTFREKRVFVQGDETMLAAINASASRVLPFLQGNSVELMKRFRAERCVAVSESFARRRGLAQGSTVAIETPSGVIALPIVGLFYDYTRDGGVVYTSMRNFTALFGEDRIHSVGVYLKPGASAEMLADAFRERLSGAGEFAVFRNREVRERVFQIFDQTFAVTYVLEAVAVIVALTGTFLAFTTLVAERTRLLAVMRGVGMSSAQLMRLLLIEAGLIGTIASGLGMVAGLALAVVLTGVINRAFFGWTVQLSIPWRSLLLTPVWVIASAVAAAVLPAWQIGRAKLGDALRLE